MTLKLRLLIGAGLLGAGTLLTAAILWMGMAAVGDRLDEALASEARISRYAQLSTQTATLLVVATEAVQTGLPADLRMERVAPVAARLDDTFALLQADVEAAVLAARGLGLDEQTRIGTQSLSLARMQALLEQTTGILARETGDRDLLRAQIDSFAAGFDPLLGEAVRAEQRFRLRILDSILALRTRLGQAAIGIACVTGLALLAFYLGLVRPQIRRLDALGGAADQIGAGRFAVELPVGRMDEIGRLSDRTNRMAAALATRADEVEAEWRRLNDTIAARTEELRAANARLSEVDENRRRFFADVSHELRTPLTVILMEAQIGQKAPGEAGFATIAARARLLSQRVDDLLRIARSESGQLAFDARPVALGDIARAVREETTAEIDAEGMVLEALPMGDAAVVADPDWLRQVAAGLVRNALRHAASGGIVRLAPALTPQEAGLSIGDAGPGIPDADRARVFDRFAQGPGAGDGFGIGLALARWVIEAQGGRIALGTSPEGGLLVTLWLPRAPDGALPASEPPG